MISLSSLRRIKYFPIPIEALIEDDLQKLQEENQEVVEEDGNEQWQEEGSVVDSAKEESIGIGPPGSDYELVDDEYPLDFEDDDSDGIILGVRIYTRGVAVSVTGDVVEQMIILEEEEDEDEDEEGNVKNLKKKAAKQKGDKQGPKALWLLSLDSIYELCIWICAHSLPKEIEKKGFKILLALKR